MDDLERKARYDAAHEKVRWLQVMQTDFNKPPKLNQFGHLEYFGRVTCLEDGDRGGKVGQILFVQDGDFHGGAGGFIAMVIEVIPEVHEDRPRGQRWVDHFQYVRVKPIEWREDTSFT